MPGITSTAVQTIPVILPIEKPCGGRADISPGASKTIIQVETDQCLIGLGEAPSLNGWHKHLLDNRLLGHFFMIQRKPVFIVAGYCINPVPVGQISAENNV